MTSGTKILLALITLFVGILVLYYGFLMPDVDPGVVATRGPARDTALPDSGGLDAAATIARAGAGNTVQRRPKAKPSAATPKKSPPRLLAEPAVITEPTVAAKKEQAPPRKQQPAATDTATAVRKPPATETSRQPAVPPKPVTTPYIIRDGDTMSSIAKTWFGDERRWDLIAQANPRVDPSRLRVGQEIKLPARDAKRGATPPADRAKTITYVVRPGDSLSSIARAHYGNVAAWERVFEANRKLLRDDADTLEVGMKLNIPSAR